MEKIKIDLIEMLSKIDSKREFGEFTMTEIQKIAEKSITVIKKYNSESESLNDLRKSIKLSDKFHNENSYKKNDNIMTVLRLTKFGIESFLYKEFGIEI